MSAGEPVWFLGDVHGRWARVERVLAAAGLRSPGGRLELPASGVLVQVGDLVDHGRERPGDPADELATRRDELAASPPAVAPRAPGESVPARALLGAPRGWPATLVEEERRALLGALDVRRTLRLFMRLEEEAAPDARVVVLLGNHDLDLLRGRPRYCPREKAWLLALLGVAPDAARAHLEAGIPEHALVAAAPELAWLAARPLLWADGDAVALHGGPRRAWLDELEGAGVRDRAGLIAWLAAARAAGLSHPALDEGRSFLSPDAPEDDALRAPRLLERFLALCGARWVALGHSPFLHAPRGRWQDLRDPRLQAPCERPARLGAQGALLKLDTNLKRGGPAWLVTRQGPGWEAVDEAGARHRLEPLPLEPAPAPCITPSGLRALEAALEAARRDGRSAVADAVERARGPLLALGLQELSPLLQAALAPQAAAPAVRYLEALRAEAALRAAGAAGETLVDGWPFLLPAPRPGAGATSPPARPAPPSHPPFTPPSPPTPELLGAARRWLGRHAAHLGGPSDPEAWRVTQPRPDRLHLRPPGSAPPAPPWTLLRLPDGVLAPANLALHDPSLALQTEPPDPAPLWARLLARVPEDPLPLTCATTPELAALLELGELDALGRDPPPGAPAFRRRPLLFTTPHPAAAAAFAWKGLLLRFAPPQAALREALEAGLLAAGLFVADQGEPLDPQARWGAPDVGLELVALGEPGIAWLLRWRGP